MLLRLATAGVAFRGSGTVRAYGVSSASDGSSRTTELVYEPAGASAFTRSQTITDASGTGTLTVRFEYREDGGAVLAFTGFARAGEPAGLDAAGPLPVLAAPGSNGGAFVLSGPSDSWSYDWSLVRAGDATADLCLTLGNVLNTVHRASWQDCFRIDAAGTVLEVRVLVRHSSRSHGEETLYR